MFSKIVLCPILFALTAAFAPIPTTSSSSSRNLSLKMSSSSSFQLNPAETAFVFIEFQNEFATEGGKLHEAVKPDMEATNMLANAQKTAKAARDAGCTIIHCPINFEPGHHEIAKNPYGILQDVKEGAAFTAGEWGADFCSEMRPETGDLVVKGKSGLCGFMSTNLDFLLSQHGTKNVVLGGL